MINRRPAVTSMRMTADDMWAVVLVLPVLTLAFSLVTFGTSLFQSVSCFAAGYFSTFVLVTIFHAALVQISYAMRRRFPSHQDTAKRLVSALFFYLLTSFLAVQFSLFLYDKIGLLGIQKTPELTLRCLLVALVGNLVNAIMYDLFYTFAKLKETLVAKESLQNEHLRQQFDALKTQVNPHFLFNNLNTLSELIEEDAEASERFLNQMSKVYRYMLRSRDEAMATLQQELQCLESYFYLLKVRYGSKVVFENKTVAGKATWLLPSLTLPLIVEEAIRTSQFSKTQPLVIRLTSEENRVVIAYHRLPKQRLLEAEAFDWRFLTNRFDEHKLEGFTNTEAAGMVSITLPLLQPIPSFAAA